MKVPIERMKRLAREESHWERLAADDPRWAIRTEPGKQGAWNEAEFFATGRAEIELALSRLGAVGITPRFGTALDFGCGMGRLAQVLAERFFLVHWVDISSPLIALANERNR